MSGASHCVLWIVLILPSFLPPSLRSLGRSPAGTCHLVHTPNALRPPTPHEIATHTADRLALIHEMQDAAAAAAEEKKRAFMAKRESGRGKREEREGRQKVTEGREDELFAPRTTATTLTAQAYFSSIPSHLSPATHPWFHPSPPSTLFHTLPAAREAGVWTYPSTPLEQSRCATFRKVWTEGMYMGQGVKFGGEFLVYPGKSRGFSGPPDVLTPARSLAGDPLRYHSHFVTTTLPTPTTPIRPLELVAWGRLGTATKKAHLVCCVDLDAPARGEDAVECYSLEWANFG